MSLMVVFPMVRFHFSVLPPGWFSSLQELFEQSGVFQASNLWFNRQHWHRQLFWKQYKTEKKTFQLRTFIKRQKNAVNLHQLIFFSLDESQTTLLKMFSYQCFSTCIDVGVTSKVLQTKSGRTGDSRKCIVRFQLLIEHTWVAVFICPQLQRSWRNSSNYKWKSDDCFYKFSFISISEHSEIYFFLTHIALHHS